MLSKVKEKINGDLTNPLNLNILIYTCTYVLSIFCSFIPYAGVLGSDQFDYIVFMKTLTDTIVPTTVTLVLGNTIQNMVLISQAQVKRFALSVWSLIAIIGYTILYSVFRNIDFNCINYIVWFISALIVTLEMYAIAQVDVETQKNKASISG